jgi:hypothetical protein
LHALAAIAKSVSIVLLGVGGWATAQVAAAPVGGASAGLPTVIQVPTLQSIRAACMAQDVTATRVRRFRSEGGGVVAVNELFEANGGTARAKDITFLGVEGEPSGSALSLKWSQTYSRFKMLLATSGCFTVRDLGRAQQNYTMHDFGSTIRASRLAHRFVVFPNVLDRAFWVIDVDQQTSALLYSAEFDCQLRLISEVEVTSFQPSARPLPMPVRLVYPDFVTAKSQMTDQGGLIDPDVSLAASYALDEVEVRDNVLSGQQMLISAYSDGIDQFLVIQLPGTSDWLAGMPGTRRGGQAMGRRYRDPTMSVHMFWEGGVTFHVAGGGALASLDALAKQVYLQALASP